MGMWIEEKIGNLIVEENKSTIQVQGASNYGEYPFFTSGESVLIHNEFLVSGEKIFLATGGKANVKYFNGKAAYSTDTYVISSEKSSTEYLYYYLLNKIDYINSNLFTGSGLKHLQKNDFKKLKLILPEDKAEQTRIAQILSKADSAIAQTESLIAKYQRIKTGLMQDLLTKGIDEKGNIRNENTHRFKTQKGLMVPEEWEVKSLKDCTDKSTVITYGIVQTGLHVEDGIRVLRTIDLQKDKIDSSNLLRTTKEISNSYKRTVLKKFDLVCNVRASVGDFNIIEEDDLVGCNTTRGVARISPNQEINPYYLLWFLRSETNKKQMELLIKGTTFIDINIADLREILVPVPKNKNEQNAIATKLNQIIKALDLFNKQLRKLKLLKTGLMQDLLSGNVRVKTQDNVAL